MSEQTSINSGDILSNYQKIENLKTSLSHVLDRLYALEEKERARARDEHARDVLE